MVRVAKTAGFCFGVRRAVELTKKISEKTDLPIYIYGDLVHHPAVVDYFLKRGCRTIYDLEDFKSLPKGRVIIRAHGVTPREEMEIKKKHMIFDSTCVFVKSIHNSVENFSKKGYNVVIVGDCEHPEVKGIAGCVSSKVYIISSKEEAVGNSFEEPLYCVAQTTFRKEKFDEIKESLIKRFPKLIYKNTICTATTERQNECLELSLKSDVMVVVGGKNSSNSGKLFDIAKENSKEAYFVENASELLSFGIRSPNIGITAGASTPDEIIEEVEMTMNEQNGNEMSMEVVDNSFRKIFKGDVIKGTVLYVNENEVSVNINYKSDGIIDKDEISNDPVDPRELFQPGQEIDVYVLKVDDAEGMVTLSYKKVLEGQQWEELEKKFEEKSDVQCNVISPIKGGLSVSCNGLRGFMPASQVELSYVDDFSKYKGQTLTCRIIDFDKAKRRLLVSKKVVDKEVREARLEELWNSFEEGQIIHGRVERLVDFGAFVDVGGIDGLVHISDLAWRRVRKPSDVVKVGDEVDTKILAIDRERNRISLGIKQTVEEPWKVFMNNNHVGDVVEGKVVSLLDFGAFVTLQSGVDGLLHISQISKEHIEKPSDVLKEGQSVYVKITEINEEKRKISLSIRAIKPLQMPGAESEENGEACSVETSEE